MRVGPLRREPYHMKTSAEGVLFTTFPIEGELVGTSFVVNHRWSENRPDLGYFPVTNRHIFGKSKAGWVTLMVVGDDDSRNPRGFEVPSEVWSLWRLHPDEEVDVCVLPLFALLGFLDLPEGVYLGLATIVVVWLMWAGRYEIAIGVLDDVAGLAGSISGFWFGSRRPSQSGQ